VKRKLVLLNLALLVLAVAAAWQLRARWLEGKAQERKVLRQPAQPAAPPAEIPVQPPPPASAAAYGEVAQKMLFSPDRNPNVVVQVTPPKPVPPFPVAYGVMDLGSGPTVILGEKPGAPSRGYPLGAKVGEFTLVGMENDEVVFEWEGQRFRKNLRELKPQPGSVAAAPVAAVARPAAAPVQTQVVSSSPDAGPGAELTGDMRACAPGDTSPAGTVRGGYRKVVTRSPFGQACTWDLIK
jgi:hypothetical protein